MPSETPTDPPSASGVVSRRGWLFVTLLAGTALILVVVSLLTRSDDEAPSSTSAVLRDNSATTISTIGPEERSEVTARLQEILKIRDEALVARNAKLLDDIYTIDCNCLKDGRALIGQLRKENLIWRGVRTDVEVRNAEEVNERLWIVVAALRTPSVRVETEDGRLVRTVPPEQNLVRFALAKPPDEEDWLLGHASTFE